MKKGDLLLVMIIVAVLAAFIIPNVFKSDEVDAGVPREAIIKVNGEHYRTVVLGEAHEEIRIETAHGTNVLEVSDYSIRMREADCPDKVCILTGTKKIPGETIVCLPHRIIVEIVDPINKGSGLDAIVQ